MKKFNHLLLAAGLLTLSVAASAMPIQGGILIGGQATLDLDNNTVSDLSISFLDAVGDFEAIFNDASDPLSIDATGDPTHNGFTYDPLGGATAPLWQIGGFDFELTNINNVDENADLLVLDGEGIFSAAGFDDTWGIWLFGGFLDNNINGPVAASVSDCDNCVTLNTRWGFASIGLAHEEIDVPEPAILGLLGLGLIGIGATRKFRKA